MSDARLLASLLAALLLCAAAPKISSEPIAGIAIITDGDTLRIGRERIRLFGIDAPEIRQTCADAKRAQYPCGAVAAERLRQHVGASPVTCAPLDVDRYKRIVARCAIQGEDLGAWMVANGWAVAYVQFSADYIGAERHAQDAKIGIWQGSFMLPSQWRASHGGQ